MHKIHTIILGIFLLAFGHPALTMEPNYDPKKDLLTICDGFESSLSGRLGCALCQCINTKFKTEKYNKYLVRLEQLNTIRQIVENSPCWQYDVDKILDDYFNDFIGPISKGFLLSCKAVLRSMKEVDIECLICLDSFKTVLIEPCGHLVYCQKCFENIDNGKKISACPKCRSECVNYNFINANFLYNQCQVCNREVADLLLDCGHVALCVDCDEKDNNNHTCPICHKASINANKIFR